MKNQQQQIEHEMNEYDEKWNKHIANTWKQNERKWRKKYNKYDDKRGFSSIHFIYEFFFHFFFVVIYSFLIRFVLCYFVSFIRYQQNCLQWPNKVIRIWIGLRVLCAKFLFPYVFFILVSFLRLCVCCIFIIQFLMFMAIGSWEFGKKKEKTRDQIHRTPEDWKYFFDPGNSDFLTLILIRVRFWFALFYQTKFEKKNFFSCQWGARREIWLYKQNKNGKQNT